MILSSMMFLMAVSVVACAGAYLMEEGLRRMGVPGRLTWLGALAMGPALLATRALGLLGLLDVQAAAEPPPWGYVVALPAVSFGPPQDAGGLGLDGAAGILWVLSALALVALVFKTHHLLLRERSGWESAQVMGRDVFVSTDRGPAVAGMWNPWIVLPRWVLSLPENELRMVLLHEEEHMRARDTHLLALALALVGVSAWNPVTWWQLRRLRAAMEVDCDRRVLRAAPDRATYGASLLTVAARAAGPSLGLAAFTERSLNLKRRILAMTAKTSRWTAAGGGVLVVLGLVVGVQACGVESPVGPVPRTEGMVAEEVAPLESGGEAVFTPFTNAPVILNGDEVAAEIERQFPPLLREAGIGGRASVYMFIDTMGVVQDVRIDDSSGHPALDDAALRVAGTYRFGPARNRDKKVDVWVSLPVVFNPHNDLQEAREPQSLRPDPKAGPTFTPFTQAPSILNRMEIIQAMEENYPKELREQRIGGTVRIYFYVNEEGSVERTLLDRSSGNQQIDEAAAKVASLYRFTPALNKDKKVPVWVSFPITFRVQ